MHPLMPVRSSSLLKFRLLSPDEQESLELAGGGLSAGGDVGPVQAAEQVAAGRVSVVDGDTLELHGQRIRLAAIDAPEARQSCFSGGKPWPCGRRAAFALAELVGTRTVTCRWRSRDRYRRAVATCAVGGTDLGGWLVEQGWALAFRRYGLDYWRRRSGPRCPPRLVGGLVRPALGVAPRQQKRGLGGQLRRGVSRGRGAAMRCDIPTRLAWAAGQTTSRPVSASRIGTCCMLAKSSPWHGRKYFLDKMTLGDLVVAFFTHHSILVYLALGAARNRVRRGDRGRLARACPGRVAVALLYPFVEYGLHRWVLHNRLLYKSAPTAKVWKRIHYDHHQNPHDLSVLFGPSTPPAADLSADPAARLGDRRRAGRGGGPRHRGTDLRGLRVLPLRPASALHAAEPLAARDQEAPPRPSLP